MNGQGKGAEWVKKFMGIDELPEFSAKVANLLDDVFFGIYHLPERQIKKVDWLNSFDITITIRSVNLSTVDSSKLTRLVVLSHDYCVRLELIGASFGYIRMLFTNREREGDIFQKCPTFEEHLGLIRNE